MKNINKFQQGRFVDGPKYKRWSDVEKEIADKREKCLVRPSPKGKAICQCSCPDDAIWIAKMLNIAVQAEQYKRESNEI